MIQRETTKTRRTVPGQMVIRVLRTNLVLKLILLRAPMLLELASVKSLLCSSMTRHIKYNLTQNMITVQFIRNKEYQYKYTKYANI